MCNNVFNWRGFIHYFVKLPISRHFLSIKNKNTIKYCSNFIHGLPFDNHDYDIFYLLRKLITDFCDTIMECHNAVIGYKEGEISKIVLASLHIPCINVENVGIVDC